MTTTFRFPRWMVTALLALASASWTVRGDTITLLTSGTQLQTSAADGVGPTVRDTTLPAAMPYTATQTVMDGGASSETTYSLTQSGFVIDMSHHRTGVGRSGDGTPNFQVQSFAQSNGDIFFSALEDSIYEFSGSYHAQHVGAAGTVELFAYLYDWTTSEYVIRSVQRSTEAATVSFTLGQLAGDDFNQLIGSRSGRLFAGHKYSITYITDIQADPGADSGATGDGEIAFRVDALPATVPLPSAAVAGLTCLTGLSCSRRRR